MTFCIRHRRTIVRVSLDGLRASLSGFLKHLLRMVVHSLSFRRSVFGTTTAVFIKQISLSNPSLQELVSVNFQFDIYSLQFELLQLVFEENSSVLEDEYLPIRFCCSDAQRLYDSIFVLELSSQILRNFEHHPAASLATLWIIVFRFFSLTGHLERPKR